jgi:hypothetical protein
MTTQLVAQQTRRVPRVCTLRAFIDRIEDASRQAGLAG